MVHCHSVALCGGASRYSCPQPESKPAAAAASETTHRKELWKVPQWFSSAGMKFLLAECFMFSSGTSEAAHTYVALLCAAGLAYAAFIGLTRRGGGSTKAAERQS